MISLDYSPRSTLDKVRRRSGLDYYPCDAMLARVLAMALCLSVCLSQVGVLLKWLDGSSWFLAWRLPSTSPILCFKEIQVCTKIRVLPSGTFFVNSGLRKFRQGISIVERAIPLARERWTLRA